MNFIYKRNFKASSRKASMASPQRGDSPRYQISVTAARNFANDRGNMMVHLGYTDDKGLLSRQRKNTRIDNITLHDLHVRARRFGVDRRAVLLELRAAGPFRLNRTAT